VACGVAEHRNVSRGHFASVSVSVLHLDARLRCPRHLHCANNVEFARPSVQRALDKTATMLSVQQGWEETLGEPAEGAEEPDPRLVLQVRLYTKPMLTSTDPVLVRLMYIQVRMTGALLHGARFVMTSPPPPLRVLFVALVASPLPCPALPRPSLPGCVPCYCYLVPNGCGYVHQARGHPVVRQVWQVQFRSVRGVVCVVWCCVVLCCVAGSLADLSSSHTALTHNVHSHKEGFLRSTLLEYIPGTLIRKRSPEEWETMLFEAHAAVDHDTVENAELEYIRLCAELDYYGCALFPVKQMFDKKLQRRLVLGVNARGILLLKPADGVSTTAMVRPRLVVVVM